MTDETKQLFDAPWTEGYDSDTGETWVTDKNGRRVADTSKHGMRIVRMPELYDALIEVAYEHCHLCIYKNSESASKMPSPNDMATNGGASFCFQNCPRLKHWKLLRKVRDGQ